MRCVRVLICCALSGLLARAVSSADAPRPLRVVTFNVLHGGFGFRGGDGQHLDERLAMAVEGLRGLDADVIGLQEASSGRRRGDVAARLAAALGLHHVRARAGYRWVGRLASWVMGFDEGPALLSRFPIVAWDVIPMASCDHWYGRVLVCATLNTPWGPLDACATHTGSSTCQLRSLAKLLQGRRGRTPLILMADLNAIPETSGVKHLLADDGLIDTFRTANPDAPGFTVWQSVRSEAPMARRRVDYVLVAPGAEAPVRVRASRIIFDRPGRGADGKPLWPSDHYAVLSDVEVFPAAP